MFFAFVFLIVTVFIPTVPANPTVVQVTINPTAPLPLSTITFNVTILCNKTIDEVRLLVQECREDLCFVHSFNISMEKMTNDTYQAQCALLQEEATQIKYHLQIACNETWYTTNTSFIPLASDEKKDPSQDPHDQLSTPGFETSFDIVSIAFILIFNNWIRKTRNKP